MSPARYDGLADEYDAFVDTGSEYYAVAAGALEQLLGPGDGRCLDVGCGGGHFFRVPLGLGWSVTGVDASADQLRVARARAPDVDLLEGDATALPFPDGTFDAAYSTFTHTDFDDFAARGSARSSTCRSASSCPRSPGSRSSASRSQTRDRTTRR
jgi:ubiquinone/menaquinone biosynthesis C-methylase UbiE